MRPRFARTAAVLAAVSLVFVVPAAEAEEEVDTQIVDFPTRDGVSLAGLVCQPTNAEPNSPLIVLVSAWGGGTTQNFVPCQKLAERGYVVLAYGARGFGDSGGQVDVAGPQDMADASDAIDWALANTPSDPERIGMGGISYGAGISVLASAFDSRIHAVASLSGWSDLPQAFRGHHTIHAAAGAVLRASGEVFGTLSPKTRRMLDDFMSDRNLDDVASWSRARSPSTYLGEINQNRPATLLIQAWNETVFPPGQIADFYTKLTGPKRLELVPGEHAAPHVGGLLGLPNESWKTVYRWFDAHVAGTDRDIAKEPPIQLTPRGDASRLPEHYAQWKDVTTGTARFQLGANGDLSSEAARRWSTSIGSGQDTLANAGIPLVTYSLEALTKNPPTAWLPSVDRKYGAVWTSERLTEARKLRGKAHVHLTAIPPRRNGMLVAYLYDVDSFGVGKIINHVPFTWEDATPGAPLTIDIDMEPTAYDVPEGHRLGFVIDTEDPLYFLDENDQHTQLGITSSPEDPSAITLDTHG